MKYKSAEGKTYTDEDIEKWCESYERGEFPEGEYSTGEIVHGRPPRTGSEQAILTVKIPVGLKKALNNKAKQAGMTTSALVREQLAQICM